VQKQFDQARVASGLTTCQLAASAGPIRTQLKKKQHSRAEAGRRLDVADRYAVHVTSLPNRCGGRNCRQRLYHRLRKQSGGEAGGRLVSAGHADVRHRHERPEWNSLDTNGRVYVTDSGNHRVLKLGGAGLEPVTNGLPNQGSQCRLLLLVFACGATCLTHSELTRA